MWFHTSGPIGSVRGPSFLVEYAQTFFDFCNLFHILACISEMRIGQVGPFNWERQAYLWIFRHFSIGPQKSHQNFWNSLDEILLLQISLFWSINKIFLGNRYFLWNIRKEKTTRNIWEYMILCTFDLSNILWKLTQLHKIVADDISYQLLQPVPVHQKIPICVSARGG